MTAYPDIFDIRKWDQILLKRYQPIFQGVDKTCYLCGLGYCKPTSPASNPLFNKEGAWGVKGELGKCGIDEVGFKARETLLHVLIGTAGHTSHAVRLVEHLIDKFGNECSVNAGAHVTTATPITTLITGCKPKKLLEFKTILIYIQGQITHLLSSISFGTEASPEDFVSKMLHAGMLDNLAMEAADIAQISVMNMPKGESNSKIVPIGLETIDISKPVALIIGHNSSIGHELMHLLEEKGIKDSIEVCGLCCAASDGIRHSHGFKIVGNQASQLSVVQSGIADVVVLDTQCIRADIVQEARKVNSLVIATTQETALGLKDLTNIPLDNALDYILNNGTGIMLDKQKAAELALKAVVRKIRGNGQGARGNPNSFLRIGRGPIRDSEIREVAPSIVMGEIPGMIGIFGCPEGENSESETQKLAEEFIKRGYIVSTAGCVSMDIAKNRGQWSGANGQNRENLFKNNPDSFDSGNLINLGSCVSASHFISACIKIANIVCHRKIEGNYEEIADYILNRVGAVVILWGGFTQKTLSAALGMARLGIPVIFGRRFKNYGIHLIGKGDKWHITDARLGDTVQIGPVPQNLLCCAETIETALPLAAKLCMRPNDTTEGRKIKLKNYIDLYKKYINHISLFPDDINLFIRTYYDIPEDMTQELRPFLENKGWQPVFIPDPTIL